MHRAVVASGVCFTGPTIQFIDEEYDTGPILAQRVVPVLFSDTPASVAAKVLVEVLPPPLLNRKAVRLHLRACARVQSVASADPSLACSDELRCRQSRRSNWLINFGAAFGFPSTCCAAR